MEGGFEKNVRSSISIRLLPLPYYGLVSPVRREFIGSVVLEPSRCTLVNHSAQCWLYTQVHICSIFDINCVRKLRNISFENSQIDAHQ